MSTVGQSAAKTVTVTGGGGASSYTVLEGTSGVLTGLLAGTGVALLVSSAAPITWTGVTAAKSV